MVMGYVILHCTNNLLFSNDVVAKSNKLDFCSKFRKVVYLKRILHLESQCFPPVVSVGNHTPDPCSSVFVQRRPPGRGCYTCPEEVVLLHFLPSSALAQRGTLGGWQFEKTE